jgi:prepilin-type processing-associated H-X9-DG protein
MPHSRRVAGAHRSLGRKRNTSSYWLRSHISTKKTQPRVLAYRIKNASGWVGTMPGPTRIFLPYDADDGKPSGSNNYPDRVDNHGADGSNFLFCDGHAGWVARRNYIDTWNISEDTTRTRP